MKKIFMVLVVIMSLIMAAPAAVNAEVVIEEEIIQEEIIQEETPEEYEWYTDPANEDTWWAGIIRSILSVFPKEEKIEVL